LRGMQKVQFTTIGRSSACSRSPVRAHTPTSGKAFRVRASAGYSLIEVLVTLLVLSIISGLSAMVLKDTLNALRVEQCAANLQLGLMFARVEAIKRNTRVVICKSADGVTCNQHGDWASGWIIFQDADNSGTRELHEELISAHLELDSASIVSGNSNVKNYVSFTALGFSKLIGGGFQAGTFTVCPRRSVEGGVRQVILNSLGRARIASASPSVCVSAN